eukprot:6160522-Amphidinium_carterae.1
MNHPKQPFCPQESRLKRHTLQKRQTSHTTLLKNSLRRGQTCETKILQRKPGSAMQRSALPEASTWRLVWTQGALMERTPCLLFAATSVAWQPGCQFRSAPALNAQLAKLQGTYSTAGKLAAACTWRALSAVLPMSHFLVV